LLERTIRKLAFAAFGRPLLTLKAAMLRLLVPIALWLATSLGTAAEPAKPLRGSRKDEPMVDLAKVYPRIAIGLRYATAKNVTGHPIYPANARCFVRKSVADRLERARLYLRDHGANLKIWDAYRPGWAQDILWAAIQNRAYIGDPQRGGSLHTWGVAVDVTLVDQYGREFKMPTDFDTFTAEAKTLYDGNDPVVRRNVRLLQAAMKHAGFLMLYDEWWHFVARDYLSFAAVDMPLEGN
jgi:D-alanyl-D-alanine dipeptidase